MPSDVRTTTPSGSEEARVGALHGRPFGLNLRKGNDRLGESAVPVEDGPDDGDDADDHDATLDEVVHDGGHVTAEYDVCAGDKRHEDDAVFVRHVDAECDDDEARESVVDASGVGDEEDEDDGCSGDAQRLGIVALAEELGHRGGAQAMRHLAGAGAEHPPCQKRSDDGVADARPRGGQTVLETELAGVSDEDDRGEVAGSVCERREPWTNVAPAEDEAVDARGRTAGVHANANCDGDEQDEYEYFPNHDSSLQVVVVRAYRWFRPLDSMRARRMHIRVRTRPPLQRIKKAPMKTVC